MDDNKSNRNATTAKEQALLAVIQQKKKDDPLFGLKIGAKEVNQRLLDAMKDEKGAHVESLFTALGALAGFACQMALWERIKQDKTQAGQLRVVQGKDGKRYFFGDALNSTLAEDKYSVWALTGGSAQYLGAKELPDPNTIFEHVARTVGTPEFGLPQVPANHRPRHRPIQYLVAIWSKLLPIVDKFCDGAHERPILFGLAIQELMAMAKGAIAPEIAAKLVMESAIPMSKVDPAVAAA